MDKIESSANRQQPAPPTLILTRADIAALMTPADYLASAQLAFAVSAIGRAAAPPPLYIAADGGGFHAKGARLSCEDGSEYTAIKMNSNFTGNRKHAGLPTIQGALLLFEASHGCLLAIMDSIEITMQRTAAAAALAATYLARKDSVTLTICGCGDLASEVLAALAAVLPLLIRVYAWDDVPQTAAGFARDMSARLKLDVRAAEDMTAATKTSDVIASCSTAKTPYLGPDDVRPGTFIAAMGADHHDKNELFPQLMARAKVVVDSIEQCSIMGDLHHALAAAAMARDDIYSTLGDIAAGFKPGRENQDEITIFDSTGTGIQDVAAAIRVYERARENPAALRLSLGQLADTKNSHNAISSH